MSDVGGNGRRRGGRGTRGPGHLDPDLERVIAARQARLRRRPRSRRRAWVASAAVVLAAVFAGILAAAAFTGRTVLLGSCSLADLRPISLGANSFLFARNGVLLGVVPSKANRQPLKLRNMSPWLPRATVAIEDRRFFEHGALDYQGIARAALSDLQAGHIVEGGSTITQELARNLYIGNSQRTLSRKLREACLAEKLAQRLTKQQILAAYLNEVFYGRHAFGAQAGAADLLLDEGAAADAAAGGAARRAAAGALDLRPGSAPTRARSRVATRSCCAMFQSGDITRPDYLAARRGAPRPPPRQAVQQRSTSPTSSAGPRRS